MGFEQIDSKFLERITVALEKISEHLEKISEDSEHSLDFIGDRLVKIEHSMDDISNAIIASA
jgi:hypothetical protein